MQRNIPLRRSTTATLTVQPREQQCKVCEALFKPARMGQYVCGPRCAVRLPRIARAAEKARDKERKEALESLRELRAKAQAAFNAYIRARDRNAGHGCICCGQPLDWNSTLPGGAVDAGHFVSRGHAPELAFDERNCNAQRKACNRPGGTTRAAFLSGMKARYGAAVVAELEGPHAPQKLRHDDYRRIAVEYRAKARAL